MKVKKYSKTYARATLNLFRETVFTVNKQDYTEEQLQAWAGYPIDVEKWHQSLLNHYSLIVISEHGQLMGFADMDEFGYLDRLYVSKDFQRLGVAKLLINKLEKTIKSNLYWTYASKTAKPFFERMGYCTVKANRVQRENIILVNFLMKKV